MRIVFVFATLLCAIVKGHAQESQINPLLASDDSLNYLQINSVHVSDAVMRVTKSVEILLKDIKNVPREKRNFSNTVQKLDLIWFNIVNLSSKFQLILAVFEEGEVKEAVERESLRLNEFGNQLSYDSNVYRSLKEVHAAPAWAKLTTSQQKYVLKEISGFESRGIQLSQQEKSELEKLQNQITRLGQKFESNCWADADTIAFTAEELNGVPTTIQQQWISPHNLLRVPVSHSAMRDIVTYSNLPDTRKKIYKKYINRGYPANVPVLDSLIRLRYQLANMRGYRSYAAYALKGSMANTTAAVWTFQNELISKLSPLVAEHINELKKIKLAQEKTCDSLYVWDTRFYKRLYHKEHDQFDANELKNYFELNNTLNGMFRLFEKLFDFKIRPLQKLSAWNKNVTGYEIWIDGQRQGIFYLDLLSRKNKADGFFCNPIAPGCSYEKHQRLPATALIGNFESNGADNTVLLRHEDVVLLFHEFGHVLHSLIGRSQLASQWSFGVKDDFVEAPSQFLENWCWQYEAVSTFARHYKTGALLSAELFEKLKTANHFDNAFDVMSDLYYGILDLTLYDHFEGYTQSEPNAIAQKLYRLNHVSISEDIKSIYVIDHLYSYGGNCYSYVWTKAIAQDLFSVFEKTGTMNSRTGIKYRKCILEKGSSEEEEDILKCFLGRGLSNLSFIQQTLSK